MLEKILQSLHECEQFKEDKSGKVCVRMEDVEKIIYDEMLKRRTGKDNFSVNVTGIIRRVDDLGRIVIPKEIRQVLGISEGTPMEMFALDNGLYIEKHLLGMKAIDLVRNLSEIIDSANTEFCSDKVEKIQGYIQEIQKLLKQFYKKCFHSAFLFLFFLHTNNK